MLAFLTSKFGLFAAGSVLVLGLVGVQEVRVKMAEGEVRGLKAERAQMLAKAKALGAAAQAASAQAASTITSARKNVRIVTQTLVKKVPIYVPPSADAACVINSGFVQSLDAAARVPSAAGGPVEAPSGLSLSAVAANVIENYGVAYDWRAEAIGWRAWYATQAALWKGKANVP